MSLLHPTVSVPRVTDITPGLLHAMKVRAILLDVDNTLATHGSHEPFPGSIEWSHEMRKAGFRILIVSNNYPDRVAPFAEKYALPFLCRAYKPLPSGYRRALRKLGVRRKEAVVVGDQIFTDILGANAAGMKSILLEPEQEEDSLSFRIRRRLEKPLRRRIGKKRPRVPSRSGSSGISK